MNVKTASGVGYLLIDMLLAAGLVNMQVVVVVEVEAVAKMPVAG
jgi:hypothetical protein